MPYKDPEKRKAYQRQYLKTTRVGLDKPKPKPAPSQVLPLELRIETAKDVLREISEQWAAVKLDDEAKTIEKAKAIAILARVALQAIEVGDMATKLEELESTVKALTEANVG